MCQAEDGSQASTGPARTSDERIVNLGDSITDGQTYALLVEQALREAGKPVPRFFGAGIGGDTAAGMRARLERDVLEHRPTLVMLSCGINDAAHGVKLADYEADVTAIAERMKAERVKLMLLTTTNLRAAHGPAVAKLHEFNAALRRIAAKYGLTVAEVYDRMEEGRKKEATLWEADGCHLNFAGYRCMARAVLDALGQRDVPVPAELRLGLLPGLVREWKVLACKEPRTLDEKTIGAIHPDGEWRIYTVPETKKVGNWWRDQERRRGASISLAEMFGPAKSFLLVADIPSAQAKDAWLNTGCELRQVWLNGRRLLGPGAPGRGWHPGSYRIPVRLRAGTNRIVVETGSSFFVGLTDTKDW
jgi:acyl-CoA thioesterase-1